MKISSWFKHTSRNEAFMALALIIFLVGTFWWVGGLPTHELPPEQVEMFLANSLLKPEFGGKVFCAVNVLGTRRQDAVFSAVVKEYAYVGCQEYYLEAGQLKMGTGESLPVVLTARRNGAGYSLVGYQVPPDGGGGMESFPPLIRWRIASAERLSDPVTLSAQASAYFRL